MVPKKYYAVRQGRTTGVFLSWAECREQINGYSGAIYKSFLDRQEAEVFAGQAVVLEQTEQPAAEAVAYVDGSFNVHTGEFSYGAVVFHAGEEQHFAEKFTNSPLAEMRNVAGEIKGAECAMRYCVEQGIDSLDIYHDYAGIANWCTGAWKASKPGTQAYKAYYEKVSAVLTVRFFKVRGHSGDKYNDLADKLAKQALGIK